MIGQMGSKKGGKARKAGRDIVSHYGYGDKNESVRLVGTYNTSAQSLQEFYQEALITEQTRTRENSGVVVMAIVNPGNERKLTDEEFDRVHEIIGKHLPELNQCPHFRVRHEKKSDNPKVAGEGDEAPTGHSETWEHEHIGYIRVHPETGRLVKLTDSQRKMNAAMRQSEFELGLRWNESPLDRDKRMKDYLCEQSPQAAQWLDDNIRQRNQEIEQGVGEKKLRDMGKDFADRQQEIRTGIKRDELRYAAGDAWAQGATGEAFRRALEERGLVLYQRRDDDDKPREWRVADANGGNYALTKLVKESTGDGDVRKRDIDARLREVDQSKTPADLEQARARARQVGLEREAAGAHPVGLPAGNASVDKLEKLRALEAEQAAARAAMKEEHLAALKAAGARSLAEKNDLARRQKAERKALEEQQRRKRAEITAPTVKQPNPSPISGIKIGDDGRYVVTVGEKEKKIDSRMGDLLRKLQAGDAAALDAALRERTAPYGRAKVLSDLWDLGGRDDPALAKGLTDRLRAMRDEIVQIEPFNRDRLFKNESRILEAAGIDKSATERTRSKVGERDRD